MTEATKIKSLIEAVDPNDTEGMDEKIKCSEYCENEATKESHCCPHQYETYSNDCDSFCNCCDDCKHDCEMDN